MKSLTIGRVWVGMLLAVACQIASAVEAFRLPSFEQVRAQHVSSDALLLDRNGVVLTDLRIEPTVRRLDWVPLQALSPAMREALLRAEDHRFFEHSGVDWLAFAGAAWQNLWSKNKRGASTLTMQLAGLLDPALRMPQGRGVRRSYTQKWDQGRAAIELEHQWNKSQILEAYLNLAPFRGDLQGVEAASELLFGVSASQLNASQASLLAALLRGPNAQPVLVARRACHLAETLGKGALCGEITTLATTRLDAPRNLPRHALAVHLAREHLQHPGQRVTTLVDAAIQARLLTAVSRLQDPAASAVLLDNASGEVLAWIGAVSPQHPDGVLAPRALAEWAWPAQVALALEQRQLTLASPMPLGATVFDPRDAMAAPGSWMSLRAALTGHQTGVLLNVQKLNSRDAWLDRVHGLGLVSAGLAEQPDVPGELNLLQIAAIWRTFAANGQYLPPRLMPTDGLVKPRRVWRPEIAFMLQDLYASSGTGGWQTAWQLHTLDGATVWVGNTDHHTLALLIHGAGGAADLRSMLGAVDMESHAPQMPEGLINILVRYEPPAEPMHREWFLSGTEIGVVTVLPDGRPAHITYPLAGEHYVVPAESHDRWALSAESCESLRWFMDGQPLGSGTRQSWLPQPGKHRLSIRNVLDQELDSVEFSVQAGGIPAPEHTDDADEVPAS